LEQNGGVALSGNPQDVSEDRLPDAPGVNRLKLLGGLLFSLGAPDDLRRRYKVRGGYGGLRREQRE
jgi:hypothetical protein